VFFKVTIAGGHILRLDDENWVKIKDKKVFKRENIKEILV